MIGDLLGNMIGIGGLTGRVNSLESNLQRQRQLAAAMFGPYRGPTGYEAMMTPRPRQQFRECAYCGRCSSGESCPSCGAGRWKP